MIFISKKRESSTLATDLIHFYLLKIIKSSSPRNLNHYILIQIHISCERNSKPIRAAEQPFQKNKRQWSKAKCQSAVLIFKPIITLLLLPVVKNSADFCRKRNPTRQRSEMSQCDKYFMAGSRWRSEQMGSLHDLVACKLGIYFIVTSHNQERYQKTSLRTMQIAPGDKINRCSKIMVFYVML